MPHAPCLAVYDSVKSKSYQKGRVIGVARNMIW